MSIQKPRDTRDLPLETVGVRSGSRGTTTGVCPLSGTGSGSGATGEGAPARRQRPHGFFSEGDRDPDGTLVSTPHCERPKPLANQWEVGLPDSAFHTAHFLH